MSVVGIDFGNQSCRVAIAHKGIVEVIANEVSNRKTPSLVAFDGRERRIGESALTGIMSNSVNTVTEVKRLLGRRWDQPEFQSDRSGFMYTTSVGADNQIVAEVQYCDKVEKFSPEQIAGSLFGCLRRITEAKLGTSNVVDCVITVPPYFTDVMRRSVLDAANIAGLNVLRLMNETTAVALQYGILRTLPEKEPIRVLFVDIGHASMNTAVVQFVQGKLNVLGTASDRNLGGRNLDRALVSHMVQEIQSKHNMDVSTSKKAMLRLFVAAERCKRILSANSEAPWNVECIMNDVDVAGVIQRSDMEALCAGVLDRVLSPIKQVLHSTGTKPSDLFAVEVIGGCIRVPAMKQQIEAFFGSPVRTTCDGDESVARGAALQCAMLSPSFRVREFEVHDVTPYAIEVGYGPADGDIEDHSVMFTTNNQIPSVKMISFHRSDSFQLVARYQDASLLPPGTDPFLGRFVISGVPEGVDGKPPKTKVKIKVDLHGVLSVESATALEEVKDETPAPAENAAAGAAAEASAEMTDEPAAPVEGSEDSNMDTTSSSEPSGAEPAEAEADAPSSKEPAMDTSADNAPKPEEEKPRKKKLKRTPLEIQMTLMGGLSPEVFQSSFEREVEMINEDRVIAETAAKRNDLESFVYEMRDKIMAEYADYVADEPKQQLIEKLDEMEEWLYSDEGYDSQKSVYIGHIDALKGLTDPIVKRQFNDEHRGQFVASLKAAIGRYQAFAQSDEEQYAHIDSAKKESVLNKCNETDLWLSQTLSEQDRLSKSDDPVLTVEALQNRITEITRLADPIMKTPKPKPKPVEKKPEEAPAKPEENSEPAAEAAPENAAEQQPKAEEPRPDDDERMATEPTPAEDETMAVD